MRKMLKSMAMASQRGKTSLRDDEVEGQLGSSVEGKGETHVKAWCAIVSLPML